MRLTFRFSEPMIWGGGARFQPDSPEFKSELAELKTALHDHPMSNEERVKMNARLDDWAEKTRASPEARAAREQHYIETLISVKLDRFADEAMADKFSLWVTKDLMAVQTVQAMLANNFHHTETISEAVKEGGVVHPSVGVRMQEILNSDRDINTAAVRNDRTVSSPVQPVHVPRVLPTNQALPPR
jgi:hypothetical protein